MSTNRPFIGKDGGRYRDYYEKQAADKRYEQRERLIEEQKKANKLMEEQNQRIKNGGQTDNERLTNAAMEYAMLGGRIAPFYLILCLIIGIILLCMNSVFKPSIAIYILASGFLVEGISVFLKKRKENNKKGIWEYVCLVLCILLVIITILPISTLKNFLPIVNSNQYDLMDGSNDEISVERIGINGGYMYYKDYKDLDINENITIEVEYYYLNQGKKNEMTKTIDFNPQEYFRNKEKGNIDDLPSLYIVKAADLIN